MVAQGLSAARRHKHERIVSLQHIADHSLLIPFERRKAEVLLQFVVHVPNEEIRQELITAVRSSNWDELIAFQQESRKLLTATLSMDEKQVAAEIDKFHSQYASMIQYNDENSLSSIITIAYLGAMQD